MIKKLKSLLFFLSAIMMIGCSSTIIYKNDADRFNDLAAMRESKSNEIG